MAEQTARDDVTASRAQSVLPRATAPAPSPFSFSSVAAGLVSGSEAGPAEVTRVSAWMAEAYEEGRLREIWELRLAFGYGVSRDGVTDDTWFWFNALPALAALRSRMMDHPAVAMCCGVAEQAWDRSNVQQSAAVAQFNELFFT